MFEWNHNTSVWKFIREIEINDTFNGRFAVEHTIRHVEDKNIREDQSTIQFLLPNVKYYELIVNKISKEEELKKLIEEREKERKEEDEKFLNELNK
jgi:hypothetical protein